MNAPVVPISRFFPDSGGGLVDRSTNPPCTLPQRFRRDIATCAETIETAARAFDRAESAGNTAGVSALRQALLAVAGTAESYGAASIAGLAVAMARTSLDGNERTAVLALATLLQEQQHTEPELAARVKAATVAWHRPRTAGPAPRRGDGESGLVLPVPGARSHEHSESVVPIERLLFSGAGALARAREVRNQLRSAALQSGWNAESLALFDELSDLLDLAAAS